GSLAERAAVTTVMPPTRSDDVPVPEEHASAWDGLSYLPIWEEQPLAQHQLDSASFGSLSPRERAGGEGPSGSRDKAPHPNPLPAGRAKTPSADTVAAEGKEGPSPRTVLLVYPAACTQLASTIASGYDRQGSGCTVIHLQLDDRTEQVVQHAWR